MQIWYPLINIYHKNIALIYLLIFMLLFYYLCWLLEHFIYKYAKYSLTMVRVRTITTQQLIIKKTKNTRLSYLG